MAADIGIVTMIIAAAMMTGVHRTDVTVATEDFHSNKLPRNSPVTSGKT
jgi:hypothetical protein